MLEKLTICTDLFCVVLSTKYCLSRALEVKDIIVVWIAEFEKSKILVHPTVETDREGYYLDVHTGHSSGINEVVKLIPPGLFISQQSLDSSLINNEEQLRRIFPPHQESLAFYSELGASSHHLRL